MTPAIKQVRGNQPGSQPVGICTGDGGTKLIVAATTLVPFSLHAEMMRERSEKFVMVQNYSKAASNSVKSGKKKSVGCFLVNKPAQADAYGSESSTCAFDPLFQAVLDIPKLTSFQPVTASTIIADSKTLLSLFNLAADYLETPITHRAFKGKSYNEGVTIDIEWAHGRLLMKMRDPVLPSGGDYSATLASLSDDQPRRAMTYIIGGMRVVVDAPARHYDPDNALLKLLKIQTTHHWKDATPYEISVRLAWVLGLPEIPRRYKAEAFPAWKQRNAATIDRFVTLLRLVAMGVGHEAFKRRRAPTHTDGHNQFAAERGFGDLLMENLPQWLTEEQRQWQLDERRRDRDRCKYLLRWRRGEGLVLLWGRAGGETSEETSETVPDLLCDNMRSLLLAEGARWRAHPDRMPQELSFRTEIDGHYWFA